MDFKVIFRDTFVEDLGLIVQSIARHNPEAARNLGKLIVLASESLSFFPEWYPKVRQLPGIRRFIVKKHFKIFYRVQQKPPVVEILRCWDGRREGQPRTE